MTHRTARHSCSCSGGSILLLPQPHPRISKLATRDAAELAAVANAVLAVRRRQGPE
ncbi:MAG: hypothetical protein QGI09_07420 [Dehalococcoidia bacterium]|nr:hypothetical protein [Dehalococcoidia bacterium]